MQYRTRARLGRILDAGRKVGNGSFAHSKKKVVFLNAVLLKKNTQQDRETRHRYRERETFG